MESITLNAILLIFVVLIAIKTAHLQGWMDGYEDGTEDMHKLMKEHKRVLQGYKEALNELIRLEETR